MHLQKGFLSQHSFFHRMGCGNRVASVLLLEFSALLYFGGETQQVRAEKMSEERRKRHSAVMDVVIG